MAETPDRPLLTRLRVQNFRSLADVTVEFGPLTVLVGPNGAGKSNVVDALRFLRDAATRGLAQALIDRDGIQAVRRRSRGESLEVGFEVELQNQPWTVKYVLELASKEDAHRRVVREAMSVASRRRGGNRLLLEISDGQWRRPKAFMRMLNGGLEGTGDSTMFLNETVSAPLLVAGQDGKKGLQGALALAQQGGGFVEHIKASSFYDFTAGDLRSPQRLLATWPLNEEGENLSAVLNRLSNNPDAATMHAALGQLVEGVSGYRVRNVGSYLITELLYENGEGGEPVASELAQESDGTLRMLGILAALYQDPPLPLVVIEEPETNIHPGALGVLADVFEEASLRSQVLLTTHSPDLVDRLPAEALRVVEQVGGETKVGPVRKGQREAVKQKLFSPGELMRMQGLQREEEET